MKNKNFWLVLFLVGLGTWLRLIFIDKPDGLWNDEYVSWYVASIPYGKAFWQAVFAQCHMPFYYFYLKFFMHFFGNSDLMLRLTSVLPGVLSIVSMYFVGKELDYSKANVMLNSFQHRISERPCDPETSSGRRESLGILCAAMTSISSFLIYFSQEVRFYSLLFLFSSLVLLFTLKLIKEQKLSNIICFVIFNLFVVFTHTLGFIFVFLNLIFLSIFLQKGFRIKLLLPITLLSIIGLPLLFSILTTHSQSQFWGSFTVSKLGFLITDYFSPILTNIVSAPDSFFHNFSLKFIIFALIPSIIAIAGIFKALKSQERVILGLFYVFLAYILILIIASMSGKLVFVTKYTIEIYPILIALVAFGLLKFQQNWRYGLIFIFCFLNMFYLIKGHFSAPRLHRSEGHKIVAELINNAQIHKGDMILLTYYTPDRFEKYFDFKGYKALSISKGNVNEYLGVNSKENFKKFDEKIFADKFNNEVVNRLEKGQKLVVVTLSDVSRYSPEQMHLITTNEKFFSKVPYEFMLFSSLRNEIYKDGCTNLRISRIETRGSWLVMTFQKR